MYNPPNPIIPPEEGISNKVCESTKFDATMDLNYFGLYADIVCKLFEQAAFNILLINTVRIT